MYTYTEYEMEQLKKISDWKNSKKTNGVDSTNKIFNNKKINSILKFVPFSWIESVLRASSRAAQMTTYKENIKWRAKIGNIEQLKRADLILCDGMAEGVKLSNTNIAATEGGVTGYFGFIGMAADFPALLILAFRTIQQIGLCYGYEIEPDEHDVCLTILSLTGTSSVEEKVSTLMTVKGATDNVLFKKMIEKFGLGMAEKKLSSLIPYVGAAASGYTNRKFIEEIALTAKMFFQEKWLLDKKERMEN